MSKYLIDFSDLSPTTVQQSRTDTLSLDSVRIPADAMQFTFWKDNGEGNAPCYIGPTHYVTDHVCFGDLATLQKRYPDARNHEIGEGFFEADNYALVSWTHPKGEQWDGKIIVALQIGVSIVERKSGLQVWPNSVCIKGLASLEVDGKFYSPWQIREALALAKFEENAVSRYKVQYYCEKEFLSTEATDTLDTRRLTIPARATSFIILDESGGCASPQFMVSDWAEIGCYHELKEAHPTAIVKSVVGNLEGKYALVEVMHPTIPLRSHKMLYALHGFIGVVDRQSGKQLWPPIGKQT